ncbi:MAG: DUF3575 domain-containing protein, partial [Hymenobacteraceae bacterium]|nr:DUF3575 domain-containing protein [Hymenobacteraceae bacterium]MDX5397176.1 DUF3575 domain-containing protein [Hymenobacteraceae bacterium]MDX5513252.1 DUF3575 domain-containing protein [Hymenobacteraceae bacterium]
TNSFATKSSETKSIFDADGPDAPVVKRTLTFRPTSFIKSKFLVGFEQAVSEKKSIVLYGGLTAADYSAYYEAYDVFGFDFQGQFRFYVQPTKKGLSGLYAGPYAFYKKIDFDIYTSIPNPIDPPGWYYAPVTGRSAGGGVMLGYQFIIKGTAVIDVFTGGGFRFSESNIDKIRNTYYVSNIKEYTQSGVYPNLGLQVGMAF